MPTALNTASKRLTLLRARVRAATRERERCVALLQEATEVLQEAERELREAEIAERMTRKG
jgi:hypothetical protein